MERMTRLDGVRGVLAVYVMLGHALPFTSLPGWARAPFAHGEAAVDLFFALSGLVIAQSVERHGGRFAPFMAARARRLLPVYFLALGLAVFVLFLGAPVVPWVKGDALAGAILGGGLPHPLWPHVSAHLALVQGLVPQAWLPFAYVTLLGPAWSLSTEWQFYTAIGLLLAPAGGLRRFALGLLAVAVVWHFAAPLLPAGWRFSRAFLPDAAGFFALGIGTAVLLRGEGFGVFGLALIVVGALGVLSAAPSRGVIALVWAGAVWAQVHGGRFGALLDTQLAQFLGAISYPLYLFNEPVQRLLMLLAPKADVLVFTVAWLPAALIAPVVCAAMVHRFVEMKGAKRRPVFVRTPQAVDARERA